MKKKVMYSLFLVLFSLFLLAGCKKNVGTSEDNAVVDEENQTEEISYDYTFGFTCIDMSNPYYDTLEKSIETELEKVGCSLMTRDPALNVETQIQQIQEMIDAGVDAVFLCPVDWEAIQPAIDALNEAEIPIINIDTQIKDVESITAYVGSDNKNAGYVCGENLIELKPDGGKVVILESPSMNSVNERITGFEEAIAGKGFEIVARYDTKGDLEQSRQAMEEILEQYSDIDAVMCGNDQSALGALVSLGVAQRDDILIYGVDGSPDLKKELAKSNTAIAGTGAQSPINEGKDAVKVGLAILNGEDYEKNTYEPTFFINKDNVKMYGTDGWQ